MVTVALGAFLVMRSRRRRRRMAQLGLVKVTACPYWQSSCMADDIVYRNAATQSTREHVKTLAMKHADHMQLPT